MRLLLLCLATSFLFLPACASLPTAEQLETWKANTDKVLATAAGIAEGAKRTADAALAKADELKAAQLKTIAEVEALAGPLDVDGDGDVTVSEAKAAFAELRKTDEGKNLLANWETYAAVLASVLGLGVAKKGARVAVKATRQWVDADGDGKPDEPKA